MMVTASNIPVPDPIAPMKSARIVKVPIHIPPKVAAMGMYFFKTSLTLLSLWPTMLMSCSFNYFATSFGEDPETSIQVLLNNAQVPRIKAQ